MIYNLSARLKQLRQEKHLKQEQVALLVGVTKSAVSSWELEIPATLQACDRFSVLAYSMRKADCLTVSPAIRSNAIFVLSSIEEIPPKNIYLLDFAVLAHFSPISSPFRTLSYCLIDPCVCKVRYSFLALVACLAAFCAVRHSNGIVSF